jgi:hypothetical protein
MPGRRGALEKAGADIGGMDRCCSRRHLAGTGAADSTRDLNMINFLNFIGYRQKMIQSLFVQVPKWNKNKKRRP